MGKQIAKPPLTNAQLNEKISKANFYRRGEHFIRIAYPTGQGVPTIQVGSLPWDAWRQYFETHLRWVPLVMQKMIDRAPDAPQAMTVPTDYPQEFDTSFVPNQDWRPLPPKSMPDRSLHERLDELHRKFGKHWGLRQ